MVTRSDSPFRHQLPELGTGIVTRARLLGEVRQRFERRLVVVTASGGFGKTTLLAQSVLENQLDPIGVDVWLQVTDRDREPDILLAGLAEAIGHAIATRVDAEPSVDTLIETIWATAPLDISIMIDDAHVLDGSPSWPIIAELSSGLPANGHLVIGSRTAPPLPIRSLQARGAVVLIEEDQMLFDEGELKAFAEMRGLDPNVEIDLPAWPALAALTSSAGREASVGFVWESVLQTIPEERRRALALLVRFGRIDDDLVNAIAGDRWTASRVVDGLPLIESIGDERRFHDLWSEALADEVAPGEWQEALIRGAELLNERGELQRAARCLHLAGAGEQLIEVALQFASLSISTGGNARDALWFAESLPAHARTGALGRYLRLLHGGSTFAATAHDDMEEVARQAAQDGDAKLASLALWRAVQYQGDTDPGELVVTELMQALCDRGEPFARAAVGLITSHRAEARHDLDAALAAIEMYDEIDEDARVGATASRYLALGHAERVATSLEAVLADGVSDPVQAQAVWFRGEIDPSTAWPIAAELPARYSQRRYPSVHVPLLSIVASVALGAGANADARELADSALSTAEGAERRLLLFARVADALVVLAEHGDAEALARFESMMVDVPLAPWPPWAYLSAIMPIRALVPGSEWLDDLQYGPSLKMAVQAGRALAELRSSADVAPAQGLPWGSPDLLRVHVPPSMLCELACAAGLDDPTVAAAFGAIPDHVNHLRTLVDHPVAAVAEAVAARLKDEPRRPQYQLHITTLGELSVHRSDGVAVSDRVRGGRVQQLLTHLLLEDAPRRTAITAAMWPDLSPKKAAGNLRITLASLLDLIEPDRDPGTSWFVRSIDGRLQLASDGVRIDSQLLARHLDSAREAERNGLPTVALEHFQLALDAYDGDFLPDIELESVVHDRLRYQSLGYNAGCRVGELLLAKGEPEEALLFIAKAAHIDPIAERAHRLEIRCHVALGSTSAARLSGERLAAMLEREGLAPDHETSQLLARVGAKPLP